MVYNCRKQKISLRVIILFSDGSQVVDLISFWTGSNSHQCVTGSLLVKFDGKAMFAPF